MPAGSLPFSLPATAALLVLTALGIIACAVFLARRKLTMAYALVWIGVFSGFAALISVPYLLQGVARLLSSLAPEGALRVLAFATIVGFLIFFSIKISELTHRLEDLAQRLALVDLGLRKRIDEKSAPPPERG